MARPSAIRSGQNATSMDFAQPLDEALDHAGDPGEHRAAQDDDLAVDQLLGHASMALTTAWGSGLRCSSTGVPMTTTTCSLAAIADGSAVAVSLPLARMRASTSGAPGSRCGILPERTRSTALS